jgi:hypothetical protein
MRRWARVVAAGIIAVGAAGCWPAPGAGPERRSHNAAETVITADSVGALDMLWEAQLDEGPAGDPVTSVRGGVHVADTRSVYTFVPRTGALSWKHQVAAPREMAQPYVRGDQVLASVWTRSEDRAVGGADDVLALDAASGASAGAVAQGVVQAERDGRVVLVDNWFLGVPVCQCWHQDLVLQDLDDGTRLCCPHAFRGVPRPNPGTSMTLAAAGILHSGPGIVPPFDPAQGNVNALRLYDPDAPVQCPDLGVFYLCPNWGTRLDGTTATVAVLSDDQAVAYTATDAGTVYAVRAADGTVLWSTPVGSAVAAPPALANGTLYVATAASGLVAVDAVSGAVLWSGSTGDGAVTEQPAVAGPAGHAVVVVGTAGGSVHAFAADGCAAATCASAWSYATGSAVTGAPAVSNGRLYVGTGDGRLLAFGVSN